MRRFTVFVLMLAVLGAVFVPFLIWGESVAQGKQIVQATENQTLERITQAVGGISQSEYAAQAAGQNPTAQKEIFLTFDDGPCRLTSKVLDILKENKVKATFFVVGREAEKLPQLVKRIYLEGHTVAIHCYTHNYKIIYKNTDAFKADIEKCIHSIKKIIPAYVPRYMRFAGGSFGLSEKYKQAAAELGLEYIDWNAANGDSERITDEQKAVAYAVQTSNGKNSVVMLLHDNKTVSVKSLPAIISHFASKGYTFKSF